MQKEMLNINGNLINEVEIKVIKGKDGEVKAANFTLFRKIRKVEKKKKEYINYNVGYCTETRYRFNGKAYRPYKRKSCLG